MKRNRNSLVLTLTLTFILMALLVVFTARVIFRTAFSSVQELGENKASAVAADLENYLDTAKSVLWLTADTVDHMVAEGATNEEIIEYITKESANTEQQFDESYTGIYGVIRGEYIDGVFWVPPEDYDPTARDWYKTTVAGNGNVVLVSPYVDAQTGNVIISVGRSLSDNSNAMALDLTLNNVHEIVEDIQINGYGYGYVVNNDGLVIAHPDKEENGKNYDEIPEQHDLFQKVAKAGTGSFDTMIDGEKCTVFVDTVMDQWYLVIITKNSELYQAPMSLLLVSILINLVVFLLISVFYYMGYRSVQRSNARMEEMKEIERRKDYEARILKLEKYAADSANKAKSDFLADMSHEIRTPINAILGMNEMILHESKEEEILDYAGSIKSAGTTLLSIINTILDFSKIEDGRMNLVPVEFETAGLVSSLVNSISERAKTKGLEFRVEVDETTPSILLGDDVRITQVIMNLLTNAVKYTEKGSIVFRITNLGEKDGSGHLMVSVKDTGIGIRKEDIDKLSISFERVDEKRNRHIEGTGLGISIVTKLLEMMGSKLQVRSEYGVGSEFFFDLPIEIVDATPIGKYSVSRGTAKGAENRITLKAPNSKILLTDDNEMNCKVAANLLKLFSIKPVICTSGRETIDKMEKGKYDILFLDHMMPDMDGIETLKILKERSLTEDVKVIALTANAVVGAKEQYLQAGFDNYLSKPINIPEMEKMLRKYLPKDVIEEVEESAGSADDTVKNAGNTVISEVTFGDENTESIESKEKPESNRTQAEHVKNDSESNLVESEIFSVENVRKEADSERIAKLRALGINIDEGITYCGGDEDFYIEIIRDYADATEEKIAELNGFLESGNLKDYKIIVHSVKSASKTIGAMDLFEKAKALEMAAASEDKEYIDANHENVMKEYAEFSENLRKTEII
ncbi:MAG: response regulator [Lachnospiraceae bacterium]|nr:response regulator [Lachnospiraceae bacterium]